MTAPRLSCIVPFCRRTRKPRTDDSSDIRWVCGQHWRHVSRVKKLRLRRAHRHWNRLTNYGTRDCDSLPARRWCRLWHKTFDAACKEAIEAAVGIA